MHVALFAFIFPLFDDSIKIKFLKHIFILIRAGDEYIFVSMFVISLIHMYYFCYFRGINFGLSEAAASKLYA